MNKKIIALLLALTFVFSAVVLTANAEDVDAATKYVQWEVGDVIPAGADICSTFNAASLEVVYTANLADGVSYEVTSELGAIKFKDNVSDLQGETYGGAYKAKSLGDPVFLFYNSEAGVWNDIAPGAVVEDDDTWVDEALRKYLPKEVTIDFVVDDGTVRGYTTFAGWEVVSIIDDVTGLSLELNATWSVRQPEWWEEIIEILCGAIFDIIDEVSDYYSRAIPNFILTWAELLGYEA